MENLKKREKETIRKIEEIEDYQIALHDISYLRQINRELEQIYDNNESFRKGVNIAYKWSLITSIYDIYVENIEKEERGEIAI